MSISFNKLLNMLESRRISSYKLTKSDKIIGRGTFDRIKQNDSISTATINDLCNYLNCQPWDIFEFIPDEKPDNQE